MVLEQMAHHEHTIARFGALDHSGRILEAERQGFFDERMLACVECAERHGRVGLGRCRDGDGIDVQAREHLFIGEGWQTQLVGIVPTAAQIGVDDTCERAQLVVVPDQIASPEAAPDDGDSWGVGLAGRSRTSHGSSSSNGSRATSGLSTTLKRCCVATEISCHRSIATLDGGLGVGCRAGPRRSGCPPNLGARLVPTEFEWCDRT